MPLADGLTFRDFILRVAEELGVAPSDADGVPTIPVNAHHLDRCKRVVNDGLRDFYAANPRWRLLNTTLSLTFSPDGGAGTVGGDAGRYYLPLWWTDVPRRPWTYSASPFFCPIPWVDESRVLENRSRYTGAGMPQMVCSRRLTREESPAGGYEAVFWPSPSDTHTVETTVRANPPALTALDERPFAPSAFDFALLASVLARAEQDRYRTKGSRWEDWQVALAQAIELDRMSAPPTIGYVGNGSMNTNRWREQTVDTVYGEDVMSTPD